MWYPEELRKEREASGGFRGPRGRWGQVSRKRGREQIRRLPGSALWLAHLLKGSSLASEGAKNLRFALGDMISSKNAFD